MIYILVLALTYNCISLATYRYCTRWIYKWDVSFKRKLIPYLLVFSSFDTIPAQVCVPKLFSLLERSK